MKFLTLLATASLGALLGATPNADPKPVQSLQLSKTEKLDGTLTLPNRNTLLFIPDADKKEVRVLALTPDGRTAWQTTLPRMQLVSGVVNVWKALAGGDDNADSRLFPLQLFSAGNKVYVWEMMRQDNKELNLKEGQLILQQIDEQGKVTRHTFTPPEAPKKTERNLMGTYTDEEGLYMVSKLTNTREETEKFFLERYDLQGKKMQQVPLDLPQAYVTKHEDQAYHDWILAGRRAGKTYFYRALRGTDKKDNPHKIPVEYEFRTYDNAGKHLGGFTTALHKQLEANTFVNYSGPISHFPSQGHVGHIIVKTSYNGRRYSTYTYDTYDVSTAGLGEIYLDPNSEDCYIAGEYGGRPYDPTNGQDVRGTFIYRVKSDGTGATLVQTAYPAEVKKDYKFLVSTFGDNRHASLFVNPHTHDMSLQFEQAKRNVVVTYDANLKLVNQLNISSKDLPTRSLWQIGSSYAEAGNLGAAQMELPRQYMTAAKGGYCQKLANLVERTKAAPKAKFDEQPTYEYAPQGEDGALVVRYIRKVGNKVDIYVL